MKTKKSISDLAKHLADKIAAHQKCIEELLIARKECERLSIIVRDRDVEIKALKFARADLIKQITDGRVADALVTAHLVKFRDERSDVPALAKDDMIFEWSRRR